MPIPAPETLSGDAAVERLNSFCWHDSILHELRIIRARSADAAVFTLDLLSHWDTWLSRRTELHFDGCLAISADFAGGVVALSDGEMVAMAEPFSTGPHLERVAAKAPMFVTPEHREFNLVLASTGSSVHVVFFLRVHKLQ